jgi:SAM-dependent methyltransferase
MKFHNKVYRVLLIPGIRERLSFIRFVYFKRFRELYISDDSTFVSRLDYSQSHFENHDSIRERVNFLVSSLSNTKRFYDNSRLLVLGPRYESELFGYIGLGFKKSNIKAIDTFSYTKLITPGNIHNMTFESDFFDFVVCGWTLAYSQNLPTAIAEISRVIRKGGILIISFDLQPGETPGSLNTVKIANYDKPLIELLLPSFQVRSQFLGKPSWSDSTDICCLSLEKI